MCLKDKTSTQKFQFDTFITRKLCRQISEDNVLESAGGQSAKSADQKVDRKIPDVDF